MAERWFYEAFDERFMPQFCNQSLKQGLFVKSSIKYGDQQVLALSLIILELYFSLMSLFTSTIAPLMSLFALLYSLVSFYSFLGLPTTKPLDILQSHFASFKLSAFLLGYLFDSALPKTSTIDNYYIILTLLITLDAYYGFNVLIGELRLENQVDG